MPALPPVPDVIKVEFGFTVGDDLSAVVIQHTGYSGGPPSASVLNTMCGDCRTAIHTQMAELMNSAVTLASIKMTDIASDTGNVGEETDAVGGSLSANPLSGGTACLVSFPIGRRYRGGKPRSYWPFGDSGTLLDPQHWTSDFVSGVSTFTAALQSFYEGETSGGTTLTEQVAVSYYEPPNIVITNPTTGRAKTTSTRRTAPLVDIIANSFVVSPVLASQRRRVRKVR